MSRTLDLLIVGKIDLWKNLVIQKNQTKSIDESKSTYTTEYKATTIEVSFNIIEAPEYKFLTYLKDISCAIIVLDGSIDNLEFWYRKLRKHYYMIPIALITYKNNLSVTDQKQNLEYFNLTQTAEFDEPFLYFIREIFNEQKTPDVKSEDKYLDIPYSEPALEPDISGSCCIIL